ncbi:FeoB-associated Cys-rich membrane protein [Candidatus Avoscillospira sp. LCP25S3_F1]|uniref:FeoB-associated Cys-rich membrane protein n=1 Tax=Candidatus Avoscillospira sp. LCP25S3_F1 TaxID=3438825 RepID=UPI003F8EECDE
MTDVMIIAILAVILIAAARYVYRAKKNHAPCIGCSGCCSHSKTGSESSCCGCHSHTNS